MSFFATASASATVGGSATATATGTGTTLQDAINSANSSAVQAAITAANSLLNTGEDFANLYSTETFPKQVNHKEWVPIAGTDTPDFTVNQSDNTQLICNNAGLWQIILQYQMVYTQPVTISEGNNCLLSGWLNVNGIDVEYTDGTGYLNRIKTKNVLSILISRYFEQGDVIKFGVMSSSLDGVTYVNCQSYTDESGINAPSAIFTAIKAKNFFKNYSVINTPSTININQYVPFSFKETFNWDYATSDNTTIICKNPGYWTFTTQYQMVNVVAASQGSYSKVSGWFNVNGVDVPGSDAASYISLANGKTIFIIGFALYFNAGDKVKIGIRSSNSSTDGILHTLCKSYTDNSNVIAPSVLVNAVKTTDVTNLFSTLTCPVNVNNNEYVPITDDDRTDCWAIDSSDNTKIVCVKPGKWQFIVQYQMVNLIPQTSGAECEICGWLNVNGVDIENSDATGYVARTTALNILTIAFVNNYVVGDVVKFGVRSSSNNGTLNAVCQGFTDTTGIYAPSVIITASEV